MSDDLVEDAPYIDEEALAELTEAEITQDVRKADPSFLIAIVTTVLTVQDSEPSVSVPELIYITVRDYLKSSNQLNTPDNGMGLIFTYYLESYRVYYSLGTASAKLPSDPQLHNKAALSLFDLYLQHPADGTRRKLLVMSMVALHEIAVTHQSRKSEKSMTDIMNDLSTLALLAQSIPVFVRGVRRKRNLAYITWLKTFMTDVIATDDLSFMKGDETLKKVLTQITAQKNIIKL
jgi:hypothetical protein